MARDFDAIVVGSGLGGLTAGAIHGRGGNRVLVLERNEAVGGAATVYRHGALAIEASLHEIDGLDADDPKLPVLQSLGLDKHLQFVDVGDLQEVRGPLVGEPFVLPHGVDAALAATTARFPQHAAALRKYFERLSAARQAVSFASRHQDDDGLWWLSHAPEAVRRLWPLIHEGRGTVSQVLADLFGDDEAVKLAVAANLGYYHDNPDQMLFLAYAIPQASFLLGGGHYVRGGSQALSDRLADLIRESGGVVETGREANRLLLEGARIVGVGHTARDGSDPQVDDAPVVFGNAAPQRLAEMLPEGMRAAFLAPYANRRASISLWTVSVGLSRPPSDFGVAHYSTVIIPGWFKALRQYREAAAIMGEEPMDRLPPYGFVDFHRIDSGLNRSGPYLGSLCGIDRLENWIRLDQDAKRVRKERWMDRLIGDLDREFPGIAGAVVQREMATAETLQRYLNTEGGAVYGFAPVGGPVEAFRASPRTTVQGLWLASAYVMGGGFTGAILSGAKAARAVVRDAPPSELETLTPTW